MSFARDTKLASYEDVPQNRATVTVYCLKKIALMIHIYYDSLIITCYLLQGRKFQCNLNICVCVCVYMYAYVYINLLKYEIIE